MHKSADSPNKSFPHQEDGLNMENEMDTNTRLSRKTSYVGDKQIPGFGALGISDNAKGSDEQNTDLKVASDYSVSLDPTPSRSNTSSPVDRKMSFSAYLPHVERPTNNRNVKPERHVIIRSTPSTASMRIGDGVFGQKTGNQQLITRKPPPAQQKVKPPTSGASTDNDGLGKRRYLGNDPVRRRMSLLGTQITLLNQHQNSKSTDNEAQRSLMTLSIVEALSHATLVSPSSSKSSSAASSTSSLDSNCAEVSCNFMENEELTNYGTFESNDVSAVAITISEITPVVSGCSRTSSNLDVNTVNICHIVEEESTEKKGDK
jgi:hypothetical protein